MPRQLGAENVMTNETSKELFNNLFQHKALPRIPFIPWVCSFAAKLEQIPIKEMLADATLLSRSLINAQKLFGYDGIAVVFDLTLVGEACGCEIKWGGEEELPVVVSHPLAEGATIDDLNVAEIGAQGRIPVTIDATRRIAMLRGKEIPLFGIVTGPLTLANFLKGETFTADLESNTEDAIAILELAQKVVLRLCRAYCEAGVDAIVVVEDSLVQSRPELFDTEIAPLLQSMWNVIRHYNAYSMFLTRDCSQEYLQPIFELQADGIVLSGNMAYEKIKEAAVKHERCFSGTIPCAKLLAEPDKAREVAEYYVNMKESKSFFLSTEWEVPYQTPIANVHEVMKCIRQ